MSHTVITYSQCRDCGNILHVTDNETVHPTCTPKPTKAERLAEQWLDAVSANDEERERELFPQIQELDARPPRRLEAALAYAGWGWPVFPLLPLSAAIRDPEPEKAAKRPATRNGFKDATTNPDRIAQWWERHPDSNIGIPTGLTFDVIDIDIPDGPDSYAALRDSDDIPDVHGQVATASGGLHLYILATGEGNKTRIMPGIDYRGKGGYVVAPPSRLWHTERAYAWVSAPSPTITGSKAGA